MLLRNRIFLVDALTYMFDQHLCALFIHVCSHKIQCRNLAKKAFLHRFWICANFLQGEGLGWRNTCRPAGRRRWLGMYGVVQTEERGAGPPPSHSFIDFLGRRLLFEAHTVLISASMHSFTAAAPASFSSAASRVAPAAFCQIPPNIAWAVCPNHFSLWNFDFDQNWQLYIEMHVYPRPTFIAPKKSWVIIAFTANAIRAVLRFLLLRTYRGIPICRVQTIARERFKPKCSGKMVFTSRNRLDFHT